jgi:DNA-binding NarL/FixJ family response regulator
LAGLSERPWFDALFMGQTLNTLSSADPPIPPEKWAALMRQLNLSFQQSRVIELILKNYCDKEIAAEMNLKVPTVRTHIGRLFKRLQVENRLALVLKIFALIRDDEASANRRQRR